MSRMIPSFAHSKSMLLYAGSLIFVWGMLAVQTVQAGSVALENPIKIGSIEGLLTALLNIIIILMIPIIVFFIILAGFKYVTAQGNASQVEDATRALTYAIIGGVLILGAVALSQIIANVVQSF